MANFINPSKFPVYASSYGETIFDGESSIPDEKSKLLIASSIKITKKHQLQTQRELAHPYEKDLRNPKNGKKFGSSATRASRGYRNSDFDPEGRLDDPYYTPVWRRADVPYTRIDLKYFLVKPKGGDVRWHNGYKIVAGILDVEGRDGGKFPSKGFEMALGSWQDGEAEIFGNCFVSSASVSVLPGQVVEVSASVVSYSLAGNDELLSLNKANFSVNDYEYLYPVYTTVKDGESGERVLVAENLEAAYSIQVSHEPKNKILNNPDAGNADVKVLYRSLSVSSEFSGDNITEWLVNNKIKQINPDNQIYMEGTALPITVVAPIDSPYPGGQYTEYDYVVLEEMFGMYTEDLETNGIVGREDVLGMPLTSQMVGADYGSGSSASVRFEERVL